MRLATTREKIRTVAKRWALQYLPRRGAIRGVSYHVQTHEKLVALDPETATAEDVGVITGSPSWANLYCEECDGSVERAVAFRDDPGREQFFLCRECLIGGMKLIDQPAAA